MGTNVQKITDTVTLIASPQTWIEGDATQQLIKTSTLDGMQAVAGMPDLHPGRGYPIGAAFFSRGRIYPALVGNDIGCGMSFWQTEIKTAKINLEKMASKFETVESPLDETWNRQIEDLKQQKAVTNSAYDKALGTIGGGNHFAEFQMVEEIYDKTQAESVGLNPKQLQLLVHSGSRGLGQAILTDHISRFSHEGLDEGSDDFSRYIEAHDEALGWAEINRELIATRFLKAVRSEGRCLLDVNHNLVTAKKLQNTQGWLHRKGATPSDCGLVVIPGSRGDFSYLVEPISSEVSLCSLAHGAGRKWVRSDCKSRLSHKYKQQDLLKTALGSRVICGNRDLLYEEAPQAYKKCESVIAAMEDAGLIKLVAKLRPVLTFKTQGRCA